MTHIFGYARVSTDEQNLATQIDALEKAGCHRIFAEKITGTATTRPELDNLLKYVRPGDTVIVSRFFRLGRSSSHLVQLIEQFGRDGVIFKSLDLGVDSTTAAGKLVITVFAGLAEYQREELLEKTAHGRELAKAAGVHMGRRKGVEAAKLDKVRKALHAKLSIAQIVEFTGIPESTVKRYRKIIEAEKQATNAGAVSSSSGATPPR